MTTSTTTQLSMEEMFQNLEAYRVPDELLMEHTDPTTGSTSVVPSNPGPEDSLTIMEEYSQVRDTYLQRKLVRSILNHVTTHFDPSNPHAMLRVDAEDVATTTGDPPQQQQVLAAITNKASTLQQQRNELRNKYIHFQQKRNEYYQFMKLQQERPDNNDDDLVPNTGDDDDENTTMEYEHHRISQETKMQELHHRRAQLQTKWHQTQQQYQQSIAASRAALPTAWPHPNDDDDDEHRLEQLQQTNRQLQAQVENIQDIQEFYANLRLLLEELHGIRFLHTTTNDNDETSSMMTVTVQVLKRYTVNVTLDITSSSSRTNHSSTKIGCVIKSAVLTSNAMVTGPPIQKNDRNGEDAATATAVQLPIPHFDDIVQYVNTTLGYHTSSTGGESLRVVLREILARITMVEDRVQMFTELQQEPGVVATIGPLCATTSRLLLPDQEVVCSLNDPPMTLVLRCTGNCPGMEHGIYLDQLHGIGSGWQNVPTLIQETLRNEPNGPYRTPLDVIAAVRVNVVRMMPQFKVPDPPVWPIRSAGMD